jgi:hypothetical protein
MGIKFKTAKTAKAAKRYFVVKAREDFRAQGEEKVAEGKDKLLILGFGYRLHQGHE